MPSTTLILKVTKGNKDVRTCSISSTSCPEMKVATSPDTVSLTKHAIAKNALQILFNGLCEIYNIIFIITYIKHKAEKHEIRLSFRYRGSREKYRFSLKWCNSMACPRIHVMLHVTC